MTTSRYPRFSRPYPDRIDYLPLAERLLNLFGWPLLIGGLLAAGWLVLGAL